MKRNKFWAGEYIVIFESSSGNAFKAYHCYKQRENYPYLRAHIASNGDMTDGFPLIAYSNKSKWRFATIAEINRYEELDGPFDVRDLEQEFNVDFKVGDIVKVIDTSAFTGDMLEGTTATVTHIDHDESNAFPYTIKSNDGKNLLEFCNADEIELYTPQENKKFKMYDRVRHINGDYEAFVVGYDGDNGVIVEPIDSEGIEDIHSQFPQYSHYKYQSKGTYYRYPQLENELVLFIPEPKFKVNDVIVQVKFSLVLAINSTHVVSEARFEDGKYRVRLRDKGSLWFDEDDFELLSDNQKRISDTKLEVGDIVYFTGEKSEWSVLDNLERGTGYIVKDVTEDGDYIELKGKIYNHSAHRFTKTPTIKETNNLIINTNTNNNGNKSQEVQGHAISVQRISRKRRDRSESSDDQEQYRSTARKRQAKACRVEEKTFC
jgi:hypothetical protein